MAISKELLVQYVESVIDPHSEFSVEDITGKSPKDAFSYGTEQGVQWGAKGLLAAIERGDFDE